jgi:hypothetical protein
MSRATAELISTILILLGTILLASEAFGKERMIRWEDRVSAASGEAFEFLGAVFSLFTAPWRKHDVLKEMPAWILPAVAVAACLSFVGALIASWRIGVAGILGLTCGVWVAAGAASWVQFRLVELFDQIREEVQRFRWDLALCAVAIGLMGVLWLSLFTLVVALSWPVVVFLILLACLVGMAKASRDFLIWKARHELGSGFVLSGLALTLGGLILDLLVTGCSGD